MANLNKVKPKALKPGDTIGIVAPASGAFNPSTVYFGTQLLESWGFKVKLGKTVHQRHGYMAGTDLERASDLEEMFADHEVKGIVCLRGGYGSMRLLNKMNLKVVQDNPKVFVGFSDITALHLAFNQLTGLVTFHGPVLNSMVRNLAGRTRDTLLHAITNSYPLGKLTNADTSPRLFAINGGKASGSLSGGNLTLVCATLGTPFEIETKGKLLFLEEVGEEPYRIDRMLTQLELAGKFDDVAGVIFGESVECTPKQFQPSFSCTFSLEEVLIDRFKALGIPVLYNLACGHGQEKLTLPIGIDATLDADAGVLLIREGAVRKS
ncbi:MAG: LD-carboxypeptidase [Bacillota bacterium]|nr:LD-carboxypeptidase [Bacillota bacterium]